MLIVYTTVFGNTAPLHEPEVTGGARFVCFTDRRLRSRAWEIVRVPQQPAPTRACRSLKSLSHRVFPAATETLWIDACFTLRVDPHEIVTAAPQDITTFRHRRRTRITQEAAEIARLRKALPDAVMAQLAAYKADGFDTDENPQESLGENGFIVRRHTPAIKRLNEMWYGEIMRHTLRDQMSLDYCAWKLGVPVGRFPGTYLDTPYVSHTRYPRPVNDY